MSKEKYQISEKAIWLSLVIINHDLEDYLKRIKSSTKSISDSINELRLVRDSFITLKNLADCVGRVMPVLRTDATAELREKTKRIHQRVDFIDHVRNRSAGHLDTKVTERAVQWIPDIFHENNIAPVDLYMCHKALLESSINSFLGPNGNQKIFDHEIDILYPPDRQVFFDFLAELISDSLEWTKDTINHLDKIIIRYGSAMVPEMSAIAGKTNFNLSEESDFHYDPKQLLEALEHTKKEFIEMGRPDAAKALEMLEKMIN